MSDGRRAIVSVFLVVVLFSLAAANLPNSALRATMLSAATPVLNATGLDQTWSVFAPGPRRQVLEVLARIKYSDGQTGTWHMPTGGPWIGAYRDYRWRKWMEFGTSDAHPNLRRPAALWIALESKRRGRTPVEVALVRRWYDVLPIGGRRLRGPWREFTYYRLSLARLPRALSK